METLSLGAPVSANDRHDFGQDTVTVLLDGDNVGRFDREVGPQRIGLQVFDRHGLAGGRTPVAGFNAMHPTFLCGDV